ncbi:MAG: CoA-binding protein [Thermoplasmatota archaeon]
MPVLTSDADISALLGRVRRIAVVGASDNPDRASYRVFGFLRDQGYDVLPVNPVKDEVQGVACVPDLAAAAAHWEAQGKGGIDLVDVFRRPDVVEPVVADAVAAGAKAIWFQLGVVNEAAIAAADAAGLDVVVDRCPAIEIPRLGLRR